MEYQQEVCKTFKAHRELTAKEAELLDWTLGLPGEVGEVCEIVKHSVFHGEPCDKMKLAKELGDIMWYVAAVAETMNIPLDSALALNINKLRHRYAGGTFDKMMSADRHAREAKFESTEIFALIQADILQGVK